jgi:hypothetical protein
MPTKEPPMSDSRYELKLATGEIVTWLGETGEHSARRYVDAHRDASVVATRRAPVYVVSVHPSQIIG